MVSDARECERRLPPMTASSDNLPIAAPVQEVSGVDRNDRRFVATLLEIYALVLKKRDCYGSQLGVSGPQYDLITEIAQSSCLTVKELAQKLNVTSSFIAVEVNKLIELGLMTKRGDSRDRRKVVLELTSKCRTALDQLAPLSERWDTTMYRCLDGDYAGILHDVLERMVADGRAAFMEFARSVRETNTLSEFNAAIRSELRLKSARLR